MSAPRLVSARAAALGLEHCLAHPEAELFETAAGAPSIDAVLAMLWPEHTGCTPSSLDDCDDCDAVLDVYAVAWMDEVEAALAEEEGEDA